MAFDCKCPICLQEGAASRPLDSTVARTNDGTMEDISHADVGYWITCPSCGDFVVTRQDYYNLKNPSATWNRRHLSALVREQSDNPDFPLFWLRDGMDPYGDLKCQPVIPINVDELLTRWPRSVPERIDRTLCNIARLSNQAGAKVDIAYASVAFAESADEAEYHLNALVTQHLLKRVVISAPTFQVTPAGWQRYVELTQVRSSPRNPAFVAMWFGDPDQQSEMTETFSRGILPAIEASGYRGYRVDMEQHNDWIMDKVISGIRVAPFVVADFTANRNGVYFEAGFARGLGLPVIHTCRKDHMDRAHFDTRQLSHVVWEAADELHEKLKLRILGTIGVGPFPQKQR